MITDLSDEHPSPAQKGSDEPMTQDSYSESSSETDSICFDRSEETRFMGFPLLMENNPHILSEKDALLEYLATPWKYLDLASKPFLVDYLTHYHAEHLWDESDFTTCVKQIIGEAYPAGTKITRKKEFGLRYLILPINYHYPIELPLSRAFSIDRMAMSCTVINNKVFFHDPKTPEENGMPFYYKRELVDDITKHVVKRLTDKNGFEYCLISKSYKFSSQIPQENPVLKERTGIYFSAPIIRQTEKYVKRLEVVPYLGETLDIYCSKHSANEEHLLEVAHKTLKAFLEQIVEKGIIHTDIKPQNICIHMRDGELKVTFIDFDEAFLPYEGQESGGLGTPGYMAPEFFNNPSDYKVQLDIRDRGELNWIQSLKPTFRSLFNAQTDCYALGCVLFEIIEHIPSDNEFQQLAQQLCHHDPKIRAPADQMRDFLGPICMSNGTKSSLKI